MYSWFFEGIFFFVLYFDICMFCICYVVGVKNKIKILGIKKEKT